MCGYGSLTAPKIVIWFINVSFFVETTVRLKGSGIPCLQSYFQDLTIYLVRPLKWQKVANGIIGRASVQCEVFYILHWNPSLSLWVMVSFSVSSTVNRP